MRSFVRLFIFTVGAAAVAALVAVVLIAQPQPRKPPLITLANPPFALTISPLKNVFKVGEGVDLMVEIKNISKRKIWIERTDTALDYDVAVWNIDGTPAPDTDFGRRLKKEDRSDMATGGGRIADTPIDPDSIKHEQIRAVDDLYDLSSPGTYTVQIQREIPTEPERRFMADDFLMLKWHEGEPVGVVKSNTITITVIE